MAYTAALPMYDLPEMRPALEAFWAALAGRLRRAGVEHVPDRLAQDRPLEEVWSDPGLMLSQCCGSHLIGRWAKTLRPVATPCYRVPGCEGNCYASLIVVARDSGVQELEELRGRVCAINGHDSHSGMSALRALVAPLARNGRFFGEVKVSGAHVASLAMVAGRQADVAAIDCVTYALLARHRPGALAGTRPIGWTQITPAPPFVTRAGADDALVDRLRAALQGALADPALQAARGDLLLDGIEVVPAGAYRALAEAERQAARQGYPDLR